MYIESKNYSEKQVTKICLDWEADQRESWNEICAWCVERYGLPGTVYTWHPRTEYMEFRFHNESDAIHFILRWS
jgi:hypothetical protein